MLYTTTRYISQYQKANNLPYELKLIYRHMLGKNPGTINNVGVYDNTYILTLRTYIDVVIPFICSPSRIEMGDWEDQGYYT